MNIRIKTILYASLLFSLLGACSGVDSGTPDATPSSINSVTTAVPQVTGSSQPSPVPPRPSDTPKPTQEAQFTLHDLADLGRIAFMNNAGGISIINADGTGYRALYDPNKILLDNYNYSVFGMRIAWSPDGQFLAFASDMESKSSYNTNEIFIVRADGTDLKKVTNNLELCYHPDWSPSGIYLVFDCTSGDYHSILRTTQSGNDLKTLTFFGNWENPDIAPDGLSIVYQGTEANKYQKDKNISNIYVMDIDGKNIRQLTFNDRSYDPLWSPDGRSIAYTIDNQFYVMNANGDGQQIFTNDEDQRLINIEVWANGHRVDGYISGLSWSPDSN